MVAQKKGRGAKSQAPAKAKPEEVPEAQVSDSPMEVSEGNGEAQPEKEIEAATTDASQEQGNGEQTQEESNEAEAKAEEPKEEKVESGKLLVENLPSSYLFDYQEKLKELFTKHGEIINVKRGPIIVTELTTTPTLSAIVEFKNKDSLEKALMEEGTILDGTKITVAIESRAETAVLVGVPYEASSEYVRKLFAPCGEVAHIHEFSKTKYKILRVTFHEKEAVEKALKLDRELRINGFLMTVSKFRDEEEQKAHAANTNKNKRQNAAQNRAANATSPAAAPRANNNFRQRGNSNANNYNSRGNYRGSRGRGFAARGGGFPRGGFAPTTYPHQLPPQPFMGRPGGYMNDGQRPNKRLRQM